MKEKKEKGLKNRALCQITSLIVITMIVVVGVFYLIFRSKAVNDQITYSERILLNAGEYLNSYLEEVDSIAKNVNYNYYLQNYLIRALEQEQTYSNLTIVENMREYEMSSQAFNDIILTRPDVSSIMIFGKKGLLFHKTIYNYRNVIMDYSSLPWYENALKNSGQAVITGPNQHVFLSNNNEKSISVSRVIQSWEDGSFLGVVLIDLNLNKIAEICEAGNVNESSFLGIINKEGELVYQQEKGKEKINMGDSDVLECINNAMDKSDGLSCLVKLDNVEYLIVQREMDSTGWKLLNIAPFAEVTAGLHNTNLLIIICVGISLLVTLAALNQILTDIIKPLKNLQKHMARVSIENMNQQVIVQSKDEIGKLATNFNEMLMRIENLKGQVLAEQEEKRRYELQALQAQINPHFLYNTLDSIIWMAETNDSNIVPMTEALAKLFRISLNKGNEEIYLEREIEHVKNYLIIQSMRYEDKFRFEIHIDDNVKKCRIIKLILQPIVENCIYHGIKKKRGKGNIIINAFRENNILKIMVKDDGCGMTEEMCKKILSDEIVPENISGSGIGVKNVNERIKLRFGKEYGLFYSSKPGEGTTVEYILPYVQEV